ncbi:MFS transporter [Bifidobacterium gallicum]|uniref:MFS transporter n=1 Tax=Bifidobacterium gallicum TaxID=78342 RepID=UPI0002D7385D|nr:MFS transporter [Bifidobacterium gallicum]
MHSSDSEVPDSHQSGPQRFIHATTHSWTHRATDDPNRPRKERLITRDVALIMFATFCFMSASMLGNPIVAGFAGSLGANGTMMGLIAAVMSGVALFCRPVAGNLADKTSKRVLAFTGAALFLGADVWYALSSTELSLLGARLLNGVGFACISVCMATWLSMMLPLSRMGAGMGLYGTVNALAQAVGPGTGILISKHWGYRPAFVIAAVLCVLMLIAIMLIQDAGVPLSVKQARERIATDATRKQAAHDAIDEATAEFAHSLDKPGLLPDASAASQRPAQPQDCATSVASAAASPASSSTASSTSGANLTTNNPNSTATSPTSRGRFYQLFNRLFEVKVLPIAGIFMLFGLPYFANQSFLVNYCNALDLPVQPSLFFVVYAVAILALRLLMRNWFDTKSFLFFFLIGTAGTVFMLLALTFMRNDWLMFAAAIMMAFSYGIMSSVTQAEAVVIAGKARSGMANTTYYAAIDLSMCIGPLLGGVLFGALPTRWLYPCFLAVIPLMWLIYWCFHRRMHAVQH